MSDLDAAVAARFPAEWARANAGPKASKKRNALRHRYRAALILDELKAKGALCGNCAAFEPRHMYPDQHICGAKSDFYGDVITTADRSPCTWWRKNDSAS